MCADIDSDSSWFDLCVPHDVLRPDLLLTTGQSFGWKSVGDKHWAGVLDSSVYEIKQGDETTFYRTIYGECSKERLWQYFDLNHEYTIDYSKAPKSVHNIFNNNQGVRILQQDPLESLISFLCSTNNNIVRITKMVNDLRTNFGTFLLKADLNGKSVEFYTFPSLDQLCKVTPEFLKELGFGYRSNFIFKTIHILKSKGVKWLYDLRFEDYEFCRNALTRLPGVGRKVADCVLLFGLGKRESVPVDIHIKKIAESHFGVKSGKSLTDSDYNKISQAFKNLLEMMLAGHRPFYS
ncbi:7,8 dihydro-8-oxoguanine DNA glycosylase [Theileria orientalis]|uniref:DNA-(apurinic or apyrimidinic site) lyase n=1 Tax=Theileria orientalis TaxID=68886 RepID=A0A976QUV6_THEOR|nr:7,8 dihydro-8-oxoguanine DNA glycosylase [Theileria orientalis]